MSKMTESSQSGVPWVDGNSRVFGVIAHPVTHVRAPMVFNPRFAAAGVGLIKEPHDAAPGRLETLVKSPRHICNFCWLGITKENI